MLGIEWTWRILAKMSTRICRRTYALALLQRLQSPFKIHLMSFRYTCTKVMLSGGWTIFQGYVWYECTVYVVVSEKGTSVMPHFWLLKELWTSWKCTGMIPLKILTKGSVQREFPSGDLLPAEWLVSTSWNLWKNPVPVTIFYPSVTYHMFYTAVLALCVFTDCN